MKRSRILAFALGTAAVALATVAPAEAAPQGAYQYKSWRQGTCIAADTPNRLYQGSCDWRAKWVQDTADLSFRNTYLNACLDTNGSDLYLSTCNSTDPGQKWYVDQFTTGWQIRSKLNLHRVTAWNSGELSLSQPLSTDKAWFERLPG
ncbi:hypothetical protein [Streptomyces sp. NPDC096105]|uniref:hypothetical protein n=1 Tax=Streptomyces sp. NPDC096105 TaxID=3366074 RepID=UPI0038018B97